MREKDASNNWIYTDNTATLLHALYGLRSASSTPLRRGLHQVGQYFDADDSQTGGIGSDPWYTDIRGECQQAFAIVMTDGYYNGPDPGSLYNDADTNYRTTLVDSDGDYLFHDNEDQTLADVAIHYYKNDLQDSVNNRVPVGLWAQDDAQHQHVVTYGISFGVFGNYDPEVFNISSGGTDYPTWPDPSDNTTNNFSDPDRIDDLYHASVNGRGEFLTASNPEELVGALRDTFRSLTHRSGSGASLSVNGEELYAGTTMFQSKYESDTWEGDVIAFPVDLNTGQPLTGPTDQVWSAQALLNAADWDTGRDIVTLNPAGSGIPFRWANLTATQKAQLNDDPRNPGTNDGLGQGRLEFLRGRSDQEVQNGGVFRERVSKLADIVHSSPLFEGYDIDANPGYEYGVLYVGANDGMLHAFHADDGRELFAYVPNLVISNMNQLTEPEPNFKHHYFVDMAPFVKDTGPSNPDPLNLGKLLVGGLGKGGKGYFCLNVDDPLTMDESTATTWVKWEYPNPSSAAAEIDNMGYSFSQAFVVRAYTEYAPTNGARWVVIFGNGYASASGTSALYILDANTGQLLRMIDTGATGNNGLSTPLPVDIDGDARVDYVYAGDLNGNLWKFDLKDPDPAKWGVSHGADTVVIDGVVNPADGEIPAPLFKASGRERNFTTWNYTSNTTWDQPITTQPVAVRHCHTDKAGYLIIFGTGRYLSEEDIINDEYQSIYAIWDFGVHPEDYLGPFQRGAVKSFLNPDLEPNVTLLEQKITSVVTNPNDPTQNLLIFSNYDPDWDVTVQDKPKVNVGWFVDLSGFVDANGRSKERIVRDVIIRDNKLIVTSTIPENDPCEPGGSSVVYEIDKCTGGRLATAQFDINNDGVVDENDLLQIANPNWGQPGEDQWLYIPPTGIEFDTMMFPPTFLRMPDDKLETKYFSTSLGTIVTLREKGEQRGMYYWRQIGR